MLAFEENLASDLLDSYVIIDDRIVSSSGPTMIGAFRGTYITVEPSAVNKFCEHFEFTHDHAREPSTRDGFFDDSQNKN